METSQGPICKCKAGFEKTENGTCEDINECLKNPCGDNSRCRNRPGFYQCRCKKGYRRDEALCVGMYYILINLCLGANRPIYSGENIGVVVFSQLFPVIDPIQIFKSKEFLYFIWYFSFSKLRFNDVASHQ